MNTTFLTKKTPNDFFKRLHLRSLKKFQKRLYKDQTHNQKRGGVSHGLPENQKVEMKHLYSQQKTSSKKQQSNKVTPLNQ